MEPMKSLERTHIFYDRFDEVMSLMRDFLASSMEYGPVDDGKSPLPQLATMVAIDRHASTLRGVQSPAPLVTIEEVFTFDIDYLLT